MREDVRRELVAAAIRGETVTYGHLMKKFRLSRGHSAGKGVVGVVDEIGRHQEAGGAPGFGAIVVRKDTGFPGGGYFCWDGLPKGLRRSSERGNDPRLSDQEKRHIRKEQRAIWHYYQSKPKESRS